MWSGVFAWAAKQYFSTTKDQAVRITKLETIVGRGIPPPDVVDKLERFEKRLDDHAARIRAIELHCGFKGK